MASEDLHILNLPYTSLAPLSVACCLYFMRPFIYSHLHLYKTKIQKTHCVWTFCQVTARLALLSCFIHVSPSKVLLILPPFISSSVNKALVLLYIIAHMLPSLWNLLDLLPCLSKINSPYWHSTPVTLCSDYHYIGKSTLSHFITFSFICGYLPSPFNRFNSLVDSGYGLLIFS